MEKAPLVKLSSVMSSFAHFLSSVPSRSTLKYSESTISTVFTPLDPHNSAHSGHTTLPSLTPLHLSSAEQSLYGYRKILGNHTHSEHNAETGLSTNAYNKLKCSAFHLRSACCLCAGITSPYSP
eukprot:Blabericola_migrator_1__4171@NODE_2276_length_3015_cov_340_360923_g380_i1_p2_GENE_NODE_2276_length_3015_cov_340_360923_g380_i1NODE_2276_length_3015_cov_340_360923_g380_i1_p2_ORF_typecomplete_len124_score2_18E_Pc_C/PF06752_12/0_2_NODE_2276_length_3015_cov_340_360923_g380_i118182189